MTDINRKVHVKITDNSVIDKRKKLKMKAVTLVMALVYVWAFAQNYMIKLAGGK